MAASRTGPLLIAVGAVLLGLSACTSTATDGTTPDSSSPATAGAPSAPGAGAMQDKSAQQILDAALQAANSADTVTVEIISDTPQGEQKYRLMLAGDGLTGQLNLPDFGTIDVTVVDGSMYLSGDEDVYAQLLAPEVAQTVAGKWLKLPESELVATGLLPATDKTGILEQIIDPDRERTLRKVKKTKEFDGVECVGLESDGGIMWVADSEEPFPLAIEPGGDATGSFRMSAWNEPVDLQPPPADQVVDLSDQAQSGP